MHWIDTGFRRCAIWPEDRKTNKKKPKYGRATSALRRITKLQNQIDDPKAKNEKLRSDNVALRKKLVEARRAQST